MITVNTHAAKTRLSELLAQVEQYHEIVRICRSGKPIADLVPAVQQKIDPFKQCKELMGVKIYYDPTEPLQNDEWPKKSR